MTQQPTPTVLTHPKLKTSSGALLMYEPTADGQHINLYEAKGLGKPWNYAGTLKKDYARLSWNALVQAGGKRIQD